MKDKWLVTLEIDTYDGDPKSWNWDTLYIGEETVKNIILALVLSARTN